MASPARGYAHKDSEVSVWDADTEHPTCTVWDDVDATQSTEDPNNITLSTYADDDQESFEQSKLKSAEASDQHEEAAEGELGSKGKKLFCLTMSSNIWFLIGSVFYVWLAVIDLQWEKSVVDIPDWVQNADDDYSWADYPIEDDYVFQTRSSYWVSQAQIVYAIASLSFVITGFIDLFAAPGILGIFFILAGSFGFVSAIVMESNYHLSNVFNVVSVHLFLVEAVGLLTRRSFYGGLRFFVRAGDLFFLLGAVLDVVLSYIYLFNLENVALARLEVAAQVFWLVCSVIYIGATLYGRKLGGFDIDMPKHEPSEETPTDENITRNVEGSEEEKIWDAVVSEEQESAVWLGVEQDADSFDSVEKEHVA